MVSHVEQAVAARIAAVRAEFAEQRAHGLQARHVAKLRRLDPAAGGPGQPRARGDRTAPESNGAVTKSNSSSEGESHEPPRP